MEVSFLGYNQKKKELADYKKSVCKVIDQFILNDKDFIKNHINSPVKDYRVSFDFYKNQRSYFVVQFNYGMEDKYFRQYEVEFAPEEYVRLLEFMKDPDLHINTNKFNL